MSLYDGINVETAPVPDMSPSVTDKPVENKSMSGWSSGLKLMASQIKRNKKALKANTSLSRVRPAPAAAASVMGKQLAPPPPILTAKDLIADDLAVELQDEYDPITPNSYEIVFQERKAKQEKAREEERKRRHEEREKRRRRRSDSDSDSEDDKKLRRSRRKDAVAIPPPPPAASSAVPPPPTLTNATDQSQDKGIAGGPSALEELSKMKAKRTNPFGKPKFGQFASKIMSKYGWAEGQGLGKTSQGISTALAVEKTSRRGGKIVNAAAEQEEQAELEKKKEQSVVELMKNPTKVVLLQNMVGPGDVDEDLEPETAEECAKYGTVGRCLIYEIREGGIAEEEAVRIFVEFVRMESAIKAVVDLNGRFFGGRMVRASFYSEERFSKFDLAP